MAAQFEALGLEPAGAGGSYFQPVPMVRITTNEPECSLAFVRESGTTELQYWSDYVGGTQDGNVTAPVVFAGFGVTAPEAGYDDDYDDYDGIDVRGKVVAILSGAPPSFAPDQRAYYSDPWVGAANALAHGAAGRLVIFTPEVERMFPWDQLLQHARWPALSWLDEAGRPHFVGPPAAILSRKTAEELFAGAPHSLEEVFKNAESGRPRSFELPVRASLRNTTAIWDKWMQEVLHRPGDDMSQVIDLGAGAQFAKLNFLISYLVAQDDSVPSWNPGDFFGERFRRTSK